jgi:hypothetical protein
VSDHYSVDFYEEASWWEAKCNCGANLGVFPDAETACDALMQHAYEEGVAVQQAAKSGEDTGADPEKVV